MASGLHVVLVEPEIPQNTGNIARTCLAAGVTLHLVKPLGFRLRDRHIRRAGLDYWDKVDPVLHENVDAFLEKTAGGRYAFLSRKAETPYDRIDAAGEIYLVFGRESRGLPEELLAAHPSQCFRIPMTPGVRTLNLASAAAVVIYDVLRKKGFPGLI